MINFIIELINYNPFIIVGVFILSLVANIIQVGTYFRDRAKLRLEEQERNRLTKLVDTYEDVLNIAKETVEDKEKLAELKSEIQASASKASELTQKISELQKIAQQKLVSQAIDYNLSILEQSYTEIQRLREEYKDLGDFRNIPAENKEAIEKDVQIAFEKPYSFPREFIFTTTLLILFIFLLPSPANTILLPFLARNFILAFFEAVRLYPNNHIKQISVKYYSYIILFAEFGVWIGFITGITSLFSSIGNALLSMIVFAVQDWFKNFYFFNSWTSNMATILTFAIFTYIPTLFAIIMAFRDWKSIKKDVEKTALHKIQNQL